MSMTQKHYELLAEVIQESEDDFKSNAAHARFANFMASVLQFDNPRFQPARFVMACMPRWMVGTNKANPWERVASTADTRAHKV